LQLKTDLRVSEERVFELTEQFNSQHEKNNQTRENMRQMQEEYMDLQEGVVATRQSLQVHDAQFRYAWSLFAFLLRICSEFCFLFTNF